MNACKRLDRSKRYLLQRMRVMPQCMSTGSDGVGHVEAYPQRLPPRAHVQGRMHGVCYLCARLPGCSDYCISRSNKGCRNCGSIEDFATETLRHREFLNLRAPVTPWQIGEINDT